MRKESAEDCFTSGYNCGQAVYSSFADEFGISRDFALKAATGLGGGVARHGEICGAVSGGVLVLSSIFGRGENDPRENMEITYSRTQELLRSFTEKMGSVSCRELLDGCDLTTKEGRENFVSKGYGRAVCIPCIKAVVEIVESLLMYKEQ